MSDATACKALVEILGKIPEIQKTKTAKIRTKSGHEFEYNYADLAAILDKVRPLFAAQGSAIIQPVTTESSGRILLTQFVHSSGVVMELGRVVLPDTSDPQAFGSALTYYRRYALCSALGIAPEDDMDGDVETGKQKPAATPKQPDKAPQVAPKAPQTAIVKPIEKKETPDPDLNLQILKESMQKQGWTREQVVVEIKAAFEVDRVAKLSPDQFSITRKHVEQTKPGTPLVPSQHQKLSVPALLQGQDGLF